MTKFTYLPFALIIVLIAGQSWANDWTRTGPNGSTTKTYDPTNGLTITRTGQNGGSSSANVTCSRGGLVTCQRDYQATNANGQTISGQRQSQHGRFRSRAVNTATGPNGNTATRVRSTTRYSRPRVRRTVRW